MKDEIFQLTEKLFQYNRAFLKTYKEARDKGITYDFQKVIKPFVNEVRTINDAWKDRMKEWLLKEDHKHLHLKQIDSTYDHIEQLSMQSFFSETSRSRLLNANRTVEYFLLEVFKELKK